MTSSTKTKSSLGTTTTESTLNSVAITSMKTTLSSQITSAALVTPQTTTTSIVSSAPIQTAITSTLSPATKSSSVVSLQTATTSTLSPTTTSTSSGSTSSDSTARTLAKELNAQYAAGKLNGKSTCTEGEIACSADGKFAVCDHSAWVYMECASGTTCYAYDSGDSVYTQCNFSYLESNYF